MSRLEKLAREGKSFACDAKHYLNLLAERDNAARLAKTLIGGLRDLQRHVRVAVEEDATRIPPGLLAAIGAMHKAVEEGRR
jgi:hypothetical protein